MTSSLDASSALDLLDWKRRIFDLYRDIRAASDATAAWTLWRAARDDLFRTHPQSPIPETERSGLESVRYFDYDPEYRVVAEVRDAPPESYEIPTSGDETMRFTRIATCHFSLRGAERVLEMYWLDAYGGGIFLPFRDATSGKTTYGAGRYLLDTVKGSDLGTNDGRLILDFNFAYNPSCAYDPRWVCPLAPPPNRLEVPVKAGERTDSS